MKKKGFILAVVSLAGFLFLGAFLVFTDFDTGKAVEFEPNSQPKINDNSKVNIKEIADGEEIEEVEETVPEAANDNICPLTDLPIGSGTGGMGRYFAGTMHDIVAEELGMTAEELYNERWAGKSIVDLAEEQGINLEDLKAVILKERAALLEDLVEDGSITIEQKNYMEQNMETRMEQMLERDTVGPNNGQRGGMGPGKGNGNGKNWDENNDNQQFRQQGRYLRFAN